MIGRVAAFLGLFGGGLLLLFKLTDARLPTQLRPLEPPRSTSDAPGLLLDDPETVSAVFTPSGRLQYTKALETEGGWSRRFELQAADSTKGEGGAVLLEQLRLQLFDPETDTLFVTVEAAQGRTELIQGEDSLRPQMSNRIELEGVTLTLLSGTRLVPLELRTSRLGGDLDAGRFETDAFAEVIGSGLTASGRGLSLDLEQGLARFESDAECLVSGAGTMTGDGGGTGRVASAGPLTIRRTSAEEGDRIELTARRRALLAIEGPEGLRLGARELRLVARAEERDEPAPDPSPESEDAQGEDSERLRLESLEGVGEATLVVQGNEFTADRAFLRTTEAGALSEARLEGNPSAWLRVEAPEELARGPADELVRVWGDSSMTLNWEPEVGFVVAGPARLTWRETSLFASGGVSGSPPVAGEAARFHAWTSVQIDYDGWRIETDELDGRIEVDESTGEASKLFLEAEADTLIRGATDEDETVQLRAVRGLSFRGDEQGWTVPEARGVQLSLPGERPLTATADRLEDFDPRSLAFRAGGGVEIGNGETLLRGASLIARSATDLSIESDAEQLVTFDRPGVHVEARRIDREGTRVTAEEQVHAELALGGSRSEIDADRLELFGAALAEAPEERESGPTTLIANGDVRAVLEEAGERYDLSGDYLWLQRTPTEDGDAAVSDLRMTGSVTAAADSEFGRFRLRSRELDGLFFDRGGATAPELVAEDADGRLTARGEVWLETLDERELRARAEVLTLLPGGRAILEPAEGELVELSGKLPKQKRPFEMVAQRVDVTEDRIEAERPTITLLPPFEDDVDTPLDGLRASSISLIAEPDRLELAGDVSVLGRTPKGMDWSLRAQRTVFEGSSTDRGRLALARMRAEGAVEVDFTDGPRATGDRLVATTWSGRIRLEGRPAMVYLRGNVSGSTWFEFDTSDFLLRGGPGWIGQPDVDEGVR